MKILNLNDKTNTKKPMYGIIKNTVFRLLFERS